MGCIGSLVVFEIFGKGIQRPFPKAAVVPDPLQGFLHRLGIQFEVKFTTFATALQQAGTFQHAQMFGDSRQGHFKRLSQIRYPRLPAGELFKQQATRRVGQGRKGSVELTG